MKRFFFKRHTLKQQNENRHTVKHFLFSLQNKVLAGSQQLLRHVKTGKLCFGEVNEQNEDIVDQKL